MKVSTTAEEIARDAPAWGSRAASSPQTIASALEKLQPALQKSGIDHTTTRGSAHRGGLSVEHWDEAVLYTCRSTPCCLAVWSRWVQSCVL